MTSIQVFSRTQRIVVNPATGYISVVNVGGTGPQGPPGEDGAPGVDGGDMTAAEILAALLTVDGSGSGLNADLLDGINAATFTGVTDALDTRIDALEAEPGTAAEILAALLTVDGAGSGLDADLLDGTNLATLTGVTDTLDTRIDVLEAIPNGIKVTSVAYGASITPNAATTNVLNVGTLTGALTVNAPTGTPVDGQSLRFRFVQDGTGRVITWNAAFAFGTDITSAMVPVTASAKFEVMFTWDATSSKWRAMAIARGF